MTIRHPVAAIRLGRFLGFAIASVIFFSYLFLAALPDLGLAIPELVGICGGIIILLAVCQVDTKTRETGCHWSPTFILLTAAIFRAVFLWHAPELSDDIYRYVFDGLMTLSGSNPYLDAPSKICASSAQMAELVPLINHAHLATIYPPAAQWVFAGGVLLAKILGLSLLFGMKLLLVILDLFTCAIVIKLLSVLNLPGNRAVLYAWHPLPVIEIAASGHIDAAAVFFLMAAVGFVMFSRPAEEREGQGQPNRFRKPLVLTAAGLFMALAVLTKWLPLVFLPVFMLMIRPGSRRYVLAGGLIAAGALVLLFLPEFINGLETLNLYVQHWEFSGIAFRKLRQWTGEGETARLVVAGGLILTIGQVCRQVRQKNTCRQMFAGFFAISLAWVVLTPTLHPWYALYLTAFLPFAAGTAGLTLSWSVLLAYRVMIPYRMQGVWAEDDVTAFMIVLAPAASFLAVRTWYFLRKRLFNTGNDPAYTAHPRKPPDTPPVRRSSGSV